MAPGIATIIAFYCLGQWTQQQWQLTLPGSVIGMFYLFIYLMCRQQVSAALLLSSHLLLDHLILFLIPSCVGVITCFALLKKEGMAIIFILSVSIVLSLILTAWCLHIFSRYYYKSHELEVDHLADHLNKL